MILRNQQRDIIGYLRQSDLGLWIMTLHIKPLCVKTYQHRERERLEQMFYYRHPQGTIEEE
jgi:hypothetical protein